MSATHSLNRNITITAMRWLWFVWLIVFAVTTGLELRRFVSASQSPLGVVSWLTFWDIETTLPFVVLLALPIVCLVSRVARTPQAERSKTTLSASRIAVCGAVIFVVSIACSWRIGSEPINVSTAVERIQVSFADLPPAYHDEYSYLLQARTFAAGRLSYPGMKTRPDLFHQMHVLNERRTVSRYFPWTGTWMAPFEAAGHVVWGHWLAGGLSAFFFYLAMLQLADSRAAFLGGLLIAVSPGLAVFSNLLLAHHPTMLALSIFTCAFFRMMATGRLLFAFIAGIGLTLAMLGRPMTAAGFGLPFGIWLMTHLVRVGGFRLIFGFAVPLAVGFAILGVSNFEATGSVTRSAYQEYTDTFTPSHRFGFNNAIHTKAVSPKVLTAYDAWASASNLTPALAVKNVWNRLFYSAVWSLAIFPVLFGVLMSLPVLWHSADAGTDGPDATRKWGLRVVAVSFVSLHVVHIPYWFDGIMHWHYVFETAPLLLLLTAVGMVAAYDSLRLRLSQITAFGWVAALLVVGLLPGWCALSPFDNTSKVSAAVSELAFSRSRFEFYNRSVAADSIAKPALILIDERESDPQLSYVINDPQLKSPVITCRRPESDEEIDELQIAFSTRTIYDFDPTSLRFKKH